MKTITNLLLVCTVMILFTACKKEYTCRCTNAWTQQPYDETIKAKTEAEAKKECESRNAPWVDGPYDCHLK